MGNSDHLINLTRHYLRKRSFLSWGTDSSALTCSCEKELWEAGQDTPGHLTWPEGLCRSSLTLPSVSQSLKLLDNGIQYQKLVIYHVAYFEEAPVFLPVGECMDL